MSHLRGQPVAVHCGFVGVKNSQCPLNFFLQCIWFGLFNHIALQVEVQGFQHVDEERAIEVLADEELVGLIMAWNRGRSPFICQL